MLVRRRPQISFVCLAPITIAHTFPPLLFYPARLSLLGSVCLPPCVHDPLGRSAVRFGAPLPWAGFEHQARLALRPRVGGRVCFQPPPGFSPNPNPARVLFSHASSLLSFLVLRNRVFDVSPSLISNLSRHPLTVQTRSTCRTLLRRRQKIIPTIRIIIRRQYRAPKHRPLLPIKPKPFAKLPRKLQKPRLKLHGCLGRSPRPTTSPILITNTPTSARFPRAITPLLGTIRGPKCTITSKKRRLWR